MFLFFKKSTTVLVTLKKLPLSSKDWGSMAEVDIFSGKESPTELLLKTETYLMVTLGYRKFLSKPQKQSQQHFCQAFFPLTTQYHFFPTGAFNVSFWPIISCESHFKDSATGIFPSSQTYPYIVFDAFSQAHCGRIQRLNSCLFARSQSKMNKYKFTKILHVIQQNLFLFKNIFY